MKNENVKSVGYIRTSTDAKDRESLKTQRGNIERHVKVENERPYAEKHELVAIKEDNAFSGKEKRRPGFLDALEMIENGTANNLIVDNLDRFSRDTAYAIEALKRIQEAGGTLISLKEKIDFSTPHGRFMFRQFISFGEYFLELQREKVIENKEGALRDGKLTQGKPPFGFNYMGKVKANTLRRQGIEVKEGFSVNETEKAEFLKAVEMALAGESCASIEKHFKRPAGFYAKRLRWPVYHTGVWHLQFKGKSVPVYLEKFVPDEKKWKRLQEALDRRKPTKPASDPTAFEFRGRVYCDKCKEVFHCETHESKGKKYSYFKHKTGKCQGERISGINVNEGLEDRAKSAVVDYLAKNPGRVFELLEDGIADRFKRAGLAMEKIKSYQAEMREIEEKMATANRLIIDATGPVDQKDLQKQKEKLEADYAKKERAIEHQTALFDELMKAEDFRAAIKNISAEVSKGLAKKFINTPADAAKGAITKRGQAALDQAGELIKNHGRIYYNQMTKTGYVQIEMLGLIRFTIDGRAL